MKPDAAGTWAYQFDNLDVVDDAGNVIAYTISEEPVEGYETTIEEPILPTLVHQKLLKFQ